MHCQKNLNNPIRNRKRDLPAYSAVPQKTAPRCTPRMCKSIRYIPFHFTGKWTEQKRRTFVALLSNNFKLWVEIFELAVWGNISITSTASDYVLIGVFVSLSIHSLLCLFLYLYICLYFIYLLIHSLIYSFFHSLLVYPGRGYFLRVQGLWTTLNDERHQNTWLKHQCFWLIYGRCLNQSMRWIPIKWQFFRGFPQ